MLKIVKKNDGLFEIYIQFIYITDNGDLYDLANSVNAPLDHYTNNTV